MNLDWNRISDRLYTTTTTAGGAHVELQLDDIDGAWHVFSTMPELDGIGYMGEELHGAIHLTTCLIAPAHDITSWTIHGQGRVQVIWDLDPADQHEPAGAPAARSRLARLLRRAEPD